jgi:hypothetical protein
VLTDELAVMPTLDQAALIEYQHFVGTFRSRKSMGNRHRGPTLGQLVDRMSQGDIESGVNRRRGFIKH